MQVAHLDELEAFTTLDGSQIRELAGPTGAPARNQSLGAGSLPPAGCAKRTEHQLAAS